MKKTKEEILALIKDKSWKHTDDLDETACPLRNAKWIRVVNVDDVEEILNSKYSDQEKHGWVSIKDKMPKIGEIVLLLDKEIRFLGSWNGKEKPGFQYWTYLPELPQKPEV